jgi:site-specific DNA-methyltransferase (adenine-specific)
MGASVFGGNLQLIYGDCLEKMKDIPDKSINMVLCDPPYGTTACKWDVVIPFEPMWEELKRIAKDNITFVFFGSEPFSSYLRISNIKDYKYDWVWDKVTARGHLVAKKRPMQQSECISVFGGTKYYPQMVKRPADKIEVRKTTEYARTDIMGGEKGNAPVNKVYDEWYPKTIIVQSNAGSSVKSVHPTQKPVPLLEYLIKTYTLENETVLDFTMGSGSTGVACVNTNRDFIGIEKDEDYFLIAKQRIKDAMKGPA